MIEQDDRSAIVCSHVLEDKLPILRIKRDELDPEDSTDSGWQFLCHSGADENMKTIRLISIQEILDMDSSILALIDSPCGSAFVRTIGSKAWVKEKVQ
jgi:hypothetical protein